ncbi:MAG: hypothetical protein ABI797_01505 [Chloroflexota bacterium]
MLTQCLGLVFALFWLLALPYASLDLGIGSVITLLFLAANLFIVIALVAAWRFKPR